MLGFGSSQTAWSMLHKLRRAMVRPERDRLQGTVEVDGTCVGGLERVATPARVVMPAVHRVASRLKRWWLGTHQWAVSHEHFDCYLDEYTFRFNRRSSQNRGMLFYRLLENAVVTPPSPYHEMVGGKP